ncbi:sel1 repeat family protein [Pseudoalteromonas luteoviolacea]|uniref:sel1 repeat family protein n=1 Tax=Pseudoalteromonas luteoviolacea TaxID=43657 RepID=UPI001B35A73B|nr:sel1 repeat family protein [Pseudoalteromonas luteoviolacea]MBQ4810302.1 sel1 repeat family protein [Pseudoalteromonas luteoviolacea]
MEKEKELIRCGVDALINENGMLAESLFTEAYELGSGCAAFNISEMYKTGMYVIKDLDKQQYWLNKSIELGFKPPQPNPNKFNKIQLTDEQQLAMLQESVSKRKKSWLEKLVSLLNK